MARAVIHRADGHVEDIPSKLVTRLRARDRVVIETAGGGGFGDPARRDAVSLQADMDNGKVSAGQAAKACRAD
jgi:N-methylhydantoinase B